MPKTPRPRSIQADPVEAWAPGFFGESPSGVARIEQTPIDDKSAQGRNRALIRSYSRAPRGRNMRAR